MKQPIAFLTMLLALAGFSYAQDDAAITKIEVSINPKNPMMYNSPGFEVKAGAKVQLTFNNNGTLHKMAGGHNIVILKKGVGAMAFAPPVGMATMTSVQKEAAADLTDAEKKKAADYLTEAQKKQVIAYTKILGPGEKDTITFTAPAAGTYEYVCTFPGHFAAMKGTMTVK